jgi:hypothetical protein
LAVKLLNHPEPSSNEFEFGLLCIDQARQLYIPNHHSPKSLPVIGIWIKNISLKSQILFNLILRFITSNSITRLDTGHAKLLILNLSNQTPECYQCDYKPTNDKLPLFINELQFYINFDIFHDGDKEEAEGIFVKPNNAWKSEIKTQYGM